MDVSTIQLAQWRKAKDLNIELIDTTVKSGIQAFAPTWEMVMGHKAKTISDEDYTQQYRDLMLRSYMTNQTVWMGLLEKEKIAIACYCNPDKFCHRHLLVKYLEGVCNARNIPFRYLGEIG